MITTNERIGLSLFTLVYSLGWMVFSQGVELSEVGKLVASAPALYCFIWIIVAPGQLEETK